MKKFTYPLVAKYPLVLQLLAVAVISAFAGIFLAVCTSRDPISARPASSSAPAMMGAALPTDGDAGTMVCSCTCTPSTPVPPAVCPGTPEPSPEAGPEPSAEASADVRPEVRPEPVIEAGPAPLPEAAPEASTPPIGAVPRPAYNTGTGFYVVGSKLYDAKGAEFRIRGVNHLHWDAPGVGIPKTGANTERWVIDFGQSAATNSGLMSRSIANKVVPMPGNWDGTCTEDPGVLTRIVDQWVAQAAQWKAFERTALLNIANEWGPDDSTVWRDAYVSAVTRMRAAGLKHTIVIDSGGCGQATGDLVHYAAAVLAADPEHNILFDQHVYGMWCSPSGGCDPSWQTNLATGLDALKTAGIAVVIGEFGPGRSIGPSPTNMTPKEIVQAAEARGFGWLAWSFDDPAGEYTPNGCPPNDTWFALSCTGDYRTSADLTTFGRVVVEDPAIGLRTLAKPAMIF